MSMTNAKDQSVNVDALIGERVHQLMWRNQVTQTALAPILGLGQSGLSPKLRGRRGWSAIELVTVARYFDVPVGFLFGEDEGNTDPSNVRPTDYRVADSPGVVDMFTREVISA